MKKNKILLFNYFIQKCLDKEKELLKKSGFKTLMFELITAKASIFRRTASGCYTETMYIIQPNFLQELFIYVCLDAAKHEDNLFEVFDFQKTHSYYPQYGEKGNWEDRVLSSYLNEIYSVKSQLTEETKGQYLKIFDDFPREFKVTGGGNTCPRKVLINIDRLQISSKNQYTEMIDRAFERLSKQTNFDNMFQLCGKYDLYVKSLPYVGYAGEIENFLAKKST